MVEYDLKELAKILIMIRQAGRGVALNWAKGLAFRHRPLPLNKKILLEERMDGRVYWSNIMFADMPEHRPSIKVGAREIPVLKTPNPLLKKVAKWIKKQSIK